MFIPTQDFLANSVADTLGRLGPKPTAAGLHAALDEVFALADGTWNARRASVDYLLSAPKAACKAGCGWCCHQQVGITVAEAVRIAGHIATLAEETRATVCARIDATAARTRGMSTEQRAGSGLSCPFLGVGGDCTIYEVRPLRCRGLYSIDVDHCIASHHDLEGMKAKLARGELKPAFLSIPEAIYQSALSGVLAAQRRLKLAIVSLELVAAVSALLADPRLVARWLAGAKPDPKLALVARRK
ncbi:MAG: YkgJ family cysteine cluster protein [Solirubrobacterales bacterium]